jgi:hypothetical protein
MKVRKNGWKFLLDILLFALLALLYNKRALGMTFHEIGGLALYGLFVIHKILNWRWIRSITAGLFSRRVPARQKVLWVLDFLLFASFTFVIVTGILISKVVFPSSGGEARFKTAHYAVSALALALAGVHLGLHAGWIGRRLGVLKRLPAVLRRTLAVVLSVAVLAFGVAQIVSTSFLTWIGGLGSASFTGTVPAQGDEAVFGDGAEAAGGNGTGSGNGYGNGDGQGKGQGLGDGLGPHGSGGDEQASASDALTAALSFAGILLAFAVVAAWADGGLDFLRRRKRRRITPTEA